VKRKGGCGEVGVLETVTGARLLPSRRVHTGCEISAAVGRSIVHVHLRVSNANPWTGFILLSMHGSQIHSTHLQT
jgi:hypothetical protein